MPFVPLHSVPDQEASARVSLVINRVMVRRDKQPDAQVTEVIHRGAATRTQA
jgi:hypothetical protein